MTSSVRCVRDGLLDSYAGNWKVLLTVMCVVSMGWKGRVYGGRGKGWQPQLRNTHITIFTNNKLRIHDTEAAAADLSQIRTIPQCQCLISNSV